MCVGPFETRESCAEWKDQYRLPCPVVPDEGGALFRAVTGGWVPWSILVGPDGEVIFSENEFDETGSAVAIARLLEKKATAAPAALRPSARRHPARARSTVVVLGGGVGGVVAAHKLRQRLGANHRIVIVDRSADHLFAPSLLWLIVGQRRENQLVRSLDRLRRRGIEFLRDEAVEIDPEHRVVRTRGGTLDFDYLIVALGARTVPESVAGFAELAHDLYSIEGCRAICEALHGFAGGTIGILVTSLPFKCPAAPYEAAFLLEAFLRRKGVRDRSEIHLYTPEHQPMPVAGAALGEAIVDALRARGIQFHPLFTFERIRPETREIVAADGHAERVDLLIAVPPHQAPEVARSSGMVGVSGWIPVDPQTLRTEHEGVFAIGDVTAIRLSGGKSLPKAGVFAHRQADVVAQRVGDEIAGRDPRASFDGKGYCWIELGDGKAAFAGGRFYTEPEPRLRMARPGRLWHWGKVAFEQWWLRRWF